VPREAPNCGVTANCKRRDAAGIFCQIGHLRWPAHSTLSRLNECVKITAYCLTTLLRCELFGAQLRLAFLLR
jgi:hypothetical protein